MTACSSAVSVSDTFSSRTSWESVKYFLPRRKPSAIRRLLQYHKRLGPAFALIRGSTAIQRSSAMIIPIVSGICGIDKKNVVILQTDERAFSVSGIARTCFEEQNFSANFFKVVHYHISFWSFEYNPCVLRIRIMANVVRIMLYGARSS